MDPCGTQQVSKSDSEKVLFWFTVCDKISNPKPLKLVISYPVRI